MYFYTASVYKYMCLIRVKISILDEFQSDLEQKMKRRRKIENRRQMNEK